MNKLKNGQLHIPPSMSKFVLILSADWSAPTLKKKEQRQLEDFSCNEEIQFYWNVIHVTIKKKEIWKKAAWISQKQNKQFIDIINFASRTTYSQSYMPAIHILIDSDRRGKTIQRFSLFDRAHLICTSQRNCKRPLCSMFYDRHDNSQVNL